MKVRVATFNCENLFARYKFKKSPPVADITNNGFTIEDVAFDFYDQDKRRITAKAIEGVNADVIALQEVENLDVLERFRSEFLGGTKAYPHAMLIDGNDPRYIDVAVLSRHPIVHVRSYQENKLTPTSRTFIFSRDCLEVDVQIEGKTLTLFVNHFKSMMGGRDQTKEKRLNQVQAVRKLISERFGAKYPGRHAFIVLGDFNDYIEAGKEGESALPELVNWNQVENVVARLAPEEQWTHYYAGGNEYRQLDYILVSKALKPKVQAVGIERRGMPKRAKRYTGERFKGVGDDNPKASDHCPVVVELDL